MEKILYDKINQALRLLSEVVGYVESQNAVSELRPSFLHVIGGKKASENLENKIENKFCQISASPPKEDFANMAEYRYKKLKITKRADGRWWTRITRNGVEKSIYGHSIDEVKRGIDKAIKFFSSEKKAAEELPTFTLFSWLNFWNDTYKKPYNRTDSITPQMKKHIFGVAKDKPLDKVTTIELQLLLNKIESTRTRQAVANILKGAFDVAYKTKVIKDDVTTALVKVVHHKKKGEALTKAEENKFLSDIKGFYLENLFKFYILSGTRRSEALRLNSADINWQDKTLKIHGTKTDSSEREIPLFHKLGQLIRTLTPDKDGFYFNFVHEDTVTQTFKKFVPTHKLHDLRHTFATRCLEAGVDMKTVQVWLGHSDFDTTANTYSHVQKEHENKQAFRLNSYLDTDFDTDFKK